MKAMWDGASRDTLSFMPSAMLYKEWPDAVRVTREGRRWVIMRQVMRSTD
jgi:hypothetical protein